MAAAAAEAQEHDDPLDWALVQPVCIGVNLLAVAVLLAHLPFLYLRRNKFPLYARSQLMMVAENVTHIITVLAITARLADSVSTEKPRLLRFTHR